MGGTWRQQGAQGGHGAREDGGDMGSTGTIWGDSEARQGVWGAAGGAVVVAGGGRVTGVSPQLQAMVPVPAAAAAAGEGTVPRGPGLRGGQRLPRAGPRLHAQGGDIGDTG